MFQSLSRFILHRLMGWSIHVTCTIPDKCVICVAPHTSNWDFVIGKLYASAMGLTANFLMKKEWFAGPLGFLFKRMGGIPVERSRRSSLTDQLAEAARRRDHFLMAITPEATRSRNPHWKRGFYYVAHKAGLPILLFALDFEHKRIVCTQQITPSGNADADMQLINAYYSGFKGKYPEKFALDEGPAAPLSTEPTATHT